MPVSIVTYVQETMWMRDRLPFAVVGSNTLLELGTYVVFHIHNRNNYN